VAEVDLHGNFAIYAALTNYTINQKRWRGRLFKTTVNYRCFEASTKCFRMNIKYIIITVIEYNTPADGERDNETKHYTRQRHVRDGRRVNTRQSG